MAADTKRDPAQVHQEIEALLQQDAEAPFYGLVGEKIINVLEVNLELRKRYGAPSKVSGAGPARIEGRFSK